MQDDDYSSEMSAFVMEQTLAHREACLVLF